MDLIRLGRGELRDPELTRVADNLWLLPSHLQLSRFEQTLAEQWPRTMSTDDERPLDVTLALDVLSNRAAAAVDADIVMLDVGPSLGALNRSVLLACDAVALPLAPDLFGLKGLENVGPTLRDWRTHWERVRFLLRDAGSPYASLPAHAFRPIGYIVQQHLARIDRPVRGYRQWASEIPAVYHRSILDEPEPVPPLEIDTDPECIASIKHWASLVPIAQRARKPICELKQADGISGGQIQAVIRCRKEFADLATEVALRLDVRLQ